MDFKDPEKHLAFKLVILFILFGISQLIFIPNYFDVPKTDDIEYLRVNTNKVNLPVYEEFSWVISFSDKKISHIENIIIWIFFLWGFMRGIDLMYFLERYKKV